MAMTKPVPEVALVIVDSSRELLQQLLDAISPTCASMVRLNTHSCKGAAATTGTNALAETAAAIEDPVGDARLGLAEQSMPPLHQHIERVFAVPDAWR